MRNLITFLTLVGGVAMLSGCVTSPSFRGEVEFGRLLLRSEVDTLPQLTQAPDVLYPEVLLAQGIEGTAEVNYTVESNGTTSTITVTAASDAAFGDAAAAAVRFLRYVPARRGSQRVSCVVAQTFFFRIR